MNTCCHSATVSPHPHPDSEASLSALDITDCPCWTFSTSAWSYSFCKGLDNFKVSLSHPYFSGQETGTQRALVSCPE